MAEACRLCIEDVWGDPMVQSYVHPDCISRDKKPGAGRALQPMIVIGVVPHLQEL